MRAIDTLDREAAATGLAPVTEAPARPAAEIERQDDGPPVPHPGRRRSRNADGAGRR